jgi:nucleosome binding factor SPN SPT16 subunit
MKVFFKQTLTYLILPLLFLSVSIFNTGCGASKKAKAKAAEEARLAKEREERLKREEADRKRREEEERIRAQRAPYQKIEDYFSKIANAGNVDNANAIIDQALNMFSSPDAPVLIIIKKSGDIIDYDRPTTAKKYFDYMKDQKKAFNKVEKLDFDSNGKIKEMILITQ